MVSERQAKILNTLIGEYIDSAQPVSSQLLEKKYDFGICPASIRIEMQRLTDKGFLHQPHTSSGRVPTDKGYRFFVDRLIEENFVSKENFGFEEIFEKEKEDIFKFADSLVKTLSEKSCNFSLLHLLKEHISWKEGWGEIIRQPEFAERNFIGEFNEFVEDFEKNVEELSFFSTFRSARAMDDLELSSEVEIFIGKEIPFSKAKNFSIMISRCRLPEAKEGILSILGPKRMTYDRNINIINSLTKLLAKSQ